MRSSPERIPPVRRSRVLKAPIAAGVVVDVPLLGGEAEPPMPAASRPAPSDRLLALARQTAAALIRQAGEEASSLREEAMAEGKTAGERAGYQEGLARGHEEGLAQARSGAEALLAAAGREARSLLLEREEKIAQLALEVAARLLGMELTLNPEAVEQVVLATLNESDDTEVEVAVAPDDYTQALGACRAWQEAMGTGARMRLVIDRDIPRGGCRVMGPHGIVERNWQHEILSISDVFEEVARRGL